MIFNQRNHENRTKKLTQKMRSSYPRMHINISRFSMMKYDKFISKLKFRFHFLEVNKILNSRERKTFKGTPSVLFKT